ncbi:MAG: hypothetical protein MJ237_03890 [bacterium]|nr:hypothetical protein [bacterium]
MGKIFGISNLPVTIFTTPLEPHKIKYPFQEVSSQSLRPASKDSFARKNELAKNFIQKFMPGIRK